VIDRTELDDILAGRRLIVSVSGGKDSAACCLYLMELGFGPDDYDRIFFDTGWEHELLYDYIENDLPKVVGPITHLSAKVDLPEELVPIAEHFEEMLGMEYSAMVRLCLKKKVFPSRVLRWCTQNLKVFVARDYLLEQAGRVVSVVGIRAQESPSRALMLEWEYSGTFECDVWRPLIDWSEEDVIAIHQRNGVRPCRLYLEQGSTRVGCYPCIFARKSEIKAISDYTPSRIRMLAELESVMESIASGTPTWFHRGDNGQASPISDVIAWARTTRGGSVDQMELFTDPTGHQGCVRWGMCDTGSDK